MATNVYSTTVFSGALPSILAHEDGTAFRSLTMDLSFLQASSDLNTYVPAGSALTKMANGYGRVLPISPLVAAVTASSSTTITVPDSSIYKNSDALTVARPYAFATFAGTWAAADTATVTLDGVATVAVMSSSTLSQCATDLATALNADGYFSSKARAIASGAIVYVYAKTGVAYSFVVGKTSASGTFTASGNVLLGNVSVGAIHAATAINTTTNVITLAAAASVSLPIGMPIGVFVASSNIYGLCARKTLVVAASSLVFAESNDVAAYYEAPVFQNRLPYWDAALQAALPQISVV